MEKTAKKSYPKVSIITCVYNGEKYISKLLDSVLNMGYPNIEHIIVNDGSTDSTENIVMKYAELYKNKENSNLYIKYIKQDNMGLGGATNTGLKQITGEYWTWINCDDWYEKNAFSKILSYFDKKIDIVQFNYNINYIFNDEYRCLRKKLSKKQVFCLNSKSYAMRRIFSFRLPYLHYLIKTSSFDSINPSRLIFPLRHTQDVQLQAQIFANLNVKYISLACSNFLFRVDSFDKTDSCELFNVLKAIVESLKILSLPPNVILNQINVYKINFIFYRLNDSFLKKNKRNFLIYWHLYKRYIKQINWSYKKYVLIKPYFYRFIIKFVFLHNLTVMLIEFLRRRRTN